MKMQPDDDFIGYDITNPDDTARKQIIVAPAPGMQGGIMDNKWLLIAAAAVVLLVLMKKK